MALEKDVAQQEYFTRSIAYYLRREPYEPAVEAYVQKLAKQHRVPVAKVRAIRDAYVKKHPLDWQRQSRKTRRRYTRKVAVAE